MKKKIISLCLVVCLLATAIGGTLAYFTDTDRNTNEFTLGSVEIDLYETVGHKDAQGKVKMAEVEKGKGNDTNPSVKYEGVLPGDVMKKVVTVENTGDSDAYVALAIQHTHWQNFNKNIDDVYEKAPYNYGNEEMQKVTDEIFSGSGWNKLIYTKKDDGHNHGIRYYPGNVAPVDQDGSESYVGNTSTEPVLIAVDYTNMQATNTYDFGYVDNLMKYTKEEGNDATPPAGEILSQYKNYSRFGLTDNCRMWVYYLYMPANTSYELDLSVTCPTYITADNSAAFADMAIDVQAAAIQVDGFASAKEAFVELNKTTGFKY